MGDTISPTAAGYIYGRSLPQRFYCNDTIFNEDVNFLSQTQWLLVDHSARIPQAGDYFLFKCGKESLIIVRDRSDEIHAFYNVCRHRGSLICLEPTGHVKALTCPYHAWTYDLSGRLIGASSMPSEFDKTAHALKRAHLRVESGLIFVNMADGEPPSFERFIERHRPFLAPHGFDTAKIAVQMVYPTEANWKLVVENFLECYHCKPAHATYCAVHSADKLLSLGAGPGSASGDLATKFDAELAEWEQATRTAGQLVGMFGDDVDAAYFQGSSRTPIQKGFLTESVDGKPVAPLMGSYVAYDGGQTACSFNPISYVMASNDHAVLFLFAPRGPLRTDVITTWLVREDAVAGRDYDSAHLTKVWDVTLKEDKTITENNQRGVLSRHYEPGLHSLHEKRISDFVAWYMLHRRPTPTDMVDEDRIRPAS
jgi:phenylpropionate dioxygenase-like ring-hydroxylating dioxygenase large terminal subunit